LSVEERLIAKLELSNIVDEGTLLQDAVPKTTKALQSQAKKWFAAESKKPENEKAFGQPINAKMDEVLKRNSIDRALSDIWDLLQLLTTLDRWTQPLLPSSPSLQFWKTAECLGVLKRNATKYHRRYVEQHHSPMLSCRGWLG
jgi:hypothetical protein